MARQKGSVHSAASNFTDKEYAEIVAERYRALPERAGETITVERACDGKWFVCSERDA